MNVSQIEFIKELFTVANFILLVGVVIRQAKWQEKVDNRLTQLESHAKDNEKHIPMDKKIVMFVPRQELQGILESIQDSLKEIKSDLKKNLNK